MGPAQRAAARTRSAHAGSSGAHGAGTVAL